MSISTTRQLKELYVRALRLHVQVEELPEEDLLRALAIDSVQVMELLITIETTFNVEIDSPHESEKFLDSFALLTGHIESKRAQTLSSASTSR
jgi:acyl carrier protein